jgi:hypothetical protein
MAFRLSPLILALAISGCARGVMYCEGPAVKSPDGECTSQVVQDVATDGSYATLVCKDTSWHREGAPPWNAVVARGAHAPLKVEWLEDKRLEVQMNPGTKIETHQVVVGSTSYSVAVSIRERPAGSEGLQGCGLGPQ